MVEGINFENALKLYRLRHRVKPGITGLAQVRGQRGETRTLPVLERRLASDLEYIQNWFVGLDINILCLGRLGETKAAIESALAQRGGRFHVSVLDQGSDAEMQHALATRFGKASSFALYAAPENRGVAAGAQRPGGFGAWAHRCRVG